MKVVLLQNVPKVGKKFEIKNFADGYARNFLIARGLAKIADDKTINSLKKEAQESKKREEENNKKILDVLSKYTKENPLVIESKSNEKGHLFKAVRTEDIVLQMDAKELDIGSLIDLEKPIKEIGVFEINYIIADKKHSFFIEIK